MVQLAELIANIDAFRHAAAAVAAEPAIDDEDEETREEDEAGERPSGASDRAGIMEGRRASEEVEEGGGREASERTERAGMAGRRAGKGGEGREKRGEGAGLGRREGASRRAPAPARSSYLQIKIIQHESNTIGRGGEARREGRALGAQRLSRFRALSLSRSLIC